MGAGKAHIRNMGLEKHTYIIWSWKNTHTQYVAGKAHIHNMGAGKTHIHNMGLEKHTYTICGWKSTHTQ